MMGLIQKKILSAIEKAGINVDQWLEEYAFVGVRVQEELFGLKVGDKVIHNSISWVDGDPEGGEELDGVCATAWTALTHVDVEYFGEHILILGDNRYPDYGEDDGEIIMKHPTVLAIVEME